MIKKYYLAILFSLFALFKVALLWSTYHNDILLRSPQSDPKTYWILGMAIRHGDLFQSESLYTSPLYPFIVAVFVSPIGLAIFQMLLGLLATYCLFSIARHYYESEKIGIFSILLGFLYGPLLFYETRLYPTSLTISVTVFAFYLFYFRKESRYWRFIAGLCMAIAVCLTTYMILVMGAFMVTGRRCFRQLSDYAAFCLPLLLMLGFFSWRNYQIDHSFIPLGANMGINLAQGHHPSSDGSYITLPGFDGTKEHQQQQARHGGHQRIHAARERTLVENRLAHLLPVDRDWVRDCSPGYRVCSRCNLPTCDAAHHEFWGRSELCADDGRQLGQSRWVGPHWFGALP
jgi:hypothetical protein